VLTSAWSAFERRPFEAAFFLAAADSRTSFSHLSMAAEERDEDVGAAVFLAAAMTEGKEGGKILDLDRTANRIVPSWKREARGCRRLTINESSPLWRVPDPSLLRTDKVEMLRVEIVLDLGKQLGDERLGRDEGERLAGFVGGGGQGGRLGRGGSRVGEELDEPGLVSVDKAGDVDSSAQGEIDEGSIGERAWTVAKKNEGVS
jgi:hypothetical protein